MSCKLCITLTTVYEQQQEAASEVTQEAETPATKPSGPSLFPETGMVAGKS